MLFTIDIFPLSWKESDLVLVNFIPTFSLIQLFYLLLQCKFYKSVNYNEV